VERYAKKMKDGEKIGLAIVLEDVMSAIIMRKERE
jgi:hypothetical protein